MNTTFLLPLLDYFAAPFEKGFARGLMNELASPTPSPFATPEPVPTKAPGPRAPLARAAPARPRSAPALAAAPAVGATIQYRQGRGTFDATVISVDEAMGSATVERLSDGKRVDRPFAKLYAALKEASRAQAPRRVRKPARKPEPEQMPEPKSERVRVWVRRADGAMQPLEPVAPAEPVVQAEPVAPVAQAEPVAPVAQAEPVVQATVLPAESMPAPEPIAQTAPTPQAEPAVAPPAPTEIPPQQT